MAWNKAVWKCIHTCMLLLSRFSRVRPDRHVRPHRRQPTRLPRLWDSPGKNTGVGCHFLCFHTCIGIYIYTKRHILYRGTLTYNETEGMLSAIQCPGENVSVDTQHPGCMPVYTHIHTHLYFTWILVYHWRSWLDYYIV